MRQTKPPVAKPQPIDYRNGLAPELEPVKQYARSDGHWYHEGIGADVLSALRRSRGRQ